MTFPVQMRIHKGRMDDEFPESPHLTIFAGGYSPPCSLFPCFLANSPSSRGLADEIKVGNGNSGGQFSLIFSYLQQRTETSHEMHAAEWFTGVEM